MTVVDNARYEPEQILLDDELVAGGRARVRGQSSPHVCCRFVTRGSRRKTSARTSGTTKSEIGADILAKAEAVNVAYVPSDEGGNTAHGFKFRAPVGRYLHVTVKDGVQGIGGYLSGKPFVATVKVAPYERALTFLGEGALLSLTGDKQVGFLVARRREGRGRDRPRAAEPAAARRAADVGFLSVPSSTADLEDTLVERFVTTRDYSGKAPGKPTYDSIDVGEYLQDAGRKRRRRALPAAHPRARLAAADHAKTSPKGESDEDGRVDRGHAAHPRHRPRLHREAGEGRQPRRLRAVDPHRPAGRRARVELIGSNGLPMLTAITDATGRAHLPRPSPTEARREKTPLLIVAQKDDDMSFMPFCIERARARPLALRHRRRRKRRSRRSSCPRTCSPIAASIVRARRRTSG